MEELILAAGETLNQRIEQERVRQMLFLGPSQHVALHFKVTKENMLFFTYASVVSEKEVILQTRPQLLMGDACMTEELPGAALLAGGTDRKAFPYELPSFSQQLMDRDASLEADDQPVEDRSGSLPPINRSRGQQQGGPESPRRVEKRRPLSERRHQANKEAAALPKMGYTRPEVPEAPFKFHQTPHSLQESGRYEYLPPYLNLDGIKRPLVSTNSARSEILSGKPPPAPGTQIDQGASHNVPRPSSDPAPTVPSTVGGEFPTDPNANTWGEPFA